MTTRIITLGVVALGLTTLGTTSCAGQGGGVDGRATQIGASTRTAGQETGDGGTTKHVLDIPKWFDGVFGTQTAAISPGEGTSHGNDRDGGDEAGDGRGVASRGGNEGGAGRAAHEDADASQRGWMSLRAMAETLRSEGQHGGGGDGRFDGGDEAGAGRSDGGGENGTGETSEDDGD